jgi:hypothetical protein
MLVLMLILIKNELLFFFDYFAKQFALLQVLSHEQKALFSLYYLIELKDVPVPNTA